MPTISFDVPTAEARYKANPNQGLSDAVWDGVMESIALRLEELEGKRTELQATIDALKTTALQTVTATITAEIDARRADLEALEAEFQAVSDAYVELVAGGVYADAIQLRTKPANVPGPTVQKAIEQIATGLLTLSKKKTINVSSLYFGGL